MNRTFTTLFSACLLCMSGLTPADPTYGPEFTFTNQKIISGMGSNIKSIDLSVDEMVQQLLTLYSEKCKTEKCQILKRIDKHGAAFTVLHNGWNFTIGADVGVVEVQTSKGTLKEFKSLENQIHKEIFGVLADQGLVPHARIGGGHIHLGLNETFEGDLNYFRNFVVDRGNHPELDWGALGNHLGNAPPVAALKPEQKSALKKLIAEIDTNPTDIENFIDAINDRVYTDIPFIHFGDPTYYQAIRYRVLMADHEQTIELRGHRPQASADEFIREIELIEARLEYLKRQNKIPLNIPATHRFSAEEVVERFRNYVEETGLKWNRYKSLVPAPLLQTAIEATVHSPRNSCIRQSLSVLINGMGD